MTEDELDALTPEEMQAMCEYMLAHPTRSMDDVIAAAERNHVERLARQQAREQARVRAGLPPKTDAELAFEAELYRRS